MEIRVKPDQDSTAAGRHRRIVLIVAVVLLLVFAGRHLSQQIEITARWIEGLDGWGPVVFIGLYAVATVALVPASLLTVAAGAIFGLAAGTAYTFVAATLGASLAFLLSRYALRETVQRRLATNPRFLVLDRAIAREGRRIVLLLRLSPVFPFNVLNYVLGATDVRFHDYAIASVGMLPGTLLYVYYGKLAGDVASIAGGLAPARGPGYYAVLAVGLLATILVTTQVTRLARRSLAEVGDV